MIWSSGSDHITSHFKFFKGCLPQILPWSIIEYFAQITLLFSSLHSRAKNKFKMFVISCILIIPRILKKKLPPWFLIHSNVHDNIMAIEGCGFNKEQKNLNILRKKKFLKKNPFIRLRALIIVYSGENTPIYKSTLLLWLPLFSKISLTLPPLNTHQLFLSTIREFLFSTAYFV